MPTRHGAYLPLKGAAVPLPLKGCALTKIGFANASIPSPFSTKARGAPAIEGCEAHFH